MLFFIKDIVVLITILIPDDIKINDIKEKKVEKLHR